MIYILVKMNGTWCYLERDSIGNRDMENIRAYIDKGYIVAMCNDIKVFAGEMGLNVNEIVDSDDG